MALLRTHHQETNRVRTGPHAIQSVVDGVATATVASVRTMSNQVQRLNAAKPVQTAAMNAVQSATAARTKMPAMNRFMAKSRSTASQPTLRRLNVACAPHLRPPQALTLPTGQTNRQRNKTAASPVPNVLVTATAVIARPAVSVPSKVSARNAPPVTASQRKKKLRWKSPVVLTLQPTRNHPQWHPLLHPCPW